MNSGDKLSNHFSSFVLMILVYSISRTVISIISWKTGLFHTSSLGVFALIIEDLSLVALMMVIIIIMVIVFPSIRLNYFPHGLIQLVYAVVLSFDVVIYLENARLKINVGIDSYFVLGLAYLYFIKLFFFMLTFILFYRVLYTEISTFSKVNLLISHAFKEILLLIYSIFFIIELIISLQYAGIDFINLTSTAKFITLVAFIYATQPEN